MEDISFAPLFTRKSILLEAPGDNNAGGTNQANNNQPDRPTGTAQNTDFNIDTSDTPALGADNDDTPNTGGNQDNNQPQGVDNTGEAEAKASVETEEKEKDRQIFSTLSPQEQMIKTYKLKELYKDLYARCDNLIKKYDSLGIEFEEYATIIKKTLDTLYDLKETIVMYYHELFDYKSYYENDIMYNRYLLVLDTIRLTTEEMVKQHKDEIEDAKQPIIQQTK